MIDWKFVTEKMNAIDWKVYKRIIFLNLVIAMVIHIFVQKTCYYYHNTYLKETFQTYEIINMHGNIVWKWQFTVGPRKCDWSEIGTLS